MRSGSEVRARLINDEELSLTLWEIMALNEAIEKVLDSGGGEGR